MSEFKTRMDWVTHNKPHLSSSNMASVYVPGAGERRILSIVSRERLERVLKVMLDENEFLSPYGIRSLSKWHDTHPFRLQLDGQTLSIDYEPAESESGMFGGNSNWRGPIWFPINYLLIESLQKFHHYYGDDLKVEMPTGSDHWVTLEEVALDLSRRLIKLFERDTEGRRPSNGYNNLFQDDPHWREYVQFFEYFHGDNGAGLGASHQTGWTGLVAKLIDQAGG